MTTSRERAEGALFGLAFGDAVGFPALFHTQFLLPEKRQAFLWRSNARACADRISRVAVPFAHRLPEELVAIGPTDDTEFALLTAEILVACGGHTTPRTFAEAWRRRVLPRVEEVRTGFAERAALDNLRLGLEPPATGGDNPQHYEDGACARAVSVGIAWAGRPAEAAAVAACDAEVSHAEDGVWAARAMAAAIAAAVGGAGLMDALAAGRGELPADSWSAAMDTRAQACADATSQPFDLALRLSQEVIGGIYSYGSAAPETLPCAFALAAAAGEDPLVAVAAANTIARTADSLPALVGALRGAAAGVGWLPPAWRAVLAEARGVCLPWTRGTRLAEVAAALASLAEARA